MSTGPWDAAARRAIRCADAIFASADLRWFDAAGQAPVDTWESLDTLIRGALPAAADADPASEPFRAPVLPTRAEQRSMPGHQSQPASPASHSPATRLQPEASPHRLSSSVPVETAQSPMRTSPVATESIGERGMRARRPVTQPFVTPVANSTGLADVSRPPVTPRSRLLPRTASPQPSDPADDVPFLDVPGPHAAAGARILDFADLARPAGPALAEPPQAQSSSPTAPMLPASVPQRTAPVPGPAAAEPVRLVDGLSGVQTLMRAAVAESRARHVLVPAAPDPASDPIPAAPAASANAPVQMVAPLRAMPELDPVAEDMLVDRLVDRLQERLREQALRQFGFTGGLT